MSWILAHPLVLAGIASFASPILMAIVARFMPDKGVMNAGIAIGVTISTFGRRRAGATYEKAETLLQKKGAIFLEGVGIGLDRDDKDKIEKLEEKDSAAEAREEKNE